MSAVRSKPGAVKSSRALQRVYGEALEHLDRTSPADVSIVRQYVAELHEEARQWRVLYRSLQARVADHD